ncbi:peptidylprolyl isomerase [Geoanaerobacter pelophilus]|nr:peptidylprolyl isomerase [Geoanaerobacter pelophilus]
MRLITVLLITCCFVFFASLAFANEGTSTVVSVNGVDLTKAELDQEISKIVPMERSFHGGLSEEKQLEINKKGMETLINMELQYQDGLSKGQRLDKKALEREIDLLVAKFPMREAYLEAVEKAGFSEQTMERFVSRNIVSKNMKKFEVDDKVNVSDAMVVSYYEEKKASYMKPEEYRASIILVKVPPSALSEEREVFKKKADSVYQQLKTGADFADLAAKFSDDMSRIKGGDLGYFHAGQADDQDFDAQIQKLQVGEASSVIRSLKGFYIIKLTDKRPPRQLPFEEMKDKIRLLLVNAEKDRLYKLWIDGLRAKAKIIYPPEKKTDKGSKS